MKKPSIVIIGAGCAGLASGIALAKRGFLVTILESTNRVGGLAGGIEINGNTYEYGPHIFHTTDPEVLDDVKKFCGTVLIKFEKIIKIKFLGKYFDFPLSITDVLFKLPLLTVINAGISFSYYWFKGIFKKKSSLNNCEEVLKRYYGKVLYEIFFKNYITKVWNIGPKDLAASFAHQRIPRFDLFDFIVKIKSKFFKNKNIGISTDNFTEKNEGTQYTTEKGFMLIAQCFAKEFTSLGGNLSLNSKVNSIHFDNKKNEYTTYFNDKENLTSSILISTMPINILPTLINPSPLPSILESAYKLKFLPITFVGILINKPVGLLSSFMYFRDKTFNRVTDLGRFKIKIKPEGATILIAEVTCNKDSELWTNEEKTKNQVIEELCQENFFTKDEILESHIFKTENGYPIYLKDFEQNLNTVLNGLTNYPHLYSIGRQGKFAYVNTHVAIKMGYEIARKIEKDFPQ